jgi:hypothetical protein
MRIRQLSKTEFLSTFGQPMTKIDANAEAAFQFWNYFDEIPKEHFETHDCSECLVDTVYRDPTGRFEHVLVNSEDKNVFMVLVLDRQAFEVHGHLLLDLNEEYGVAT